MEMNRRRLDLEEARLKALDSFSHHHLEMLERSYRMLAESEAVLEHSLKLERKLGKPG